MARLFADHPEALARTIEIAQACDFSLDELKYEYPDEPVPPGFTARITCLTGSRNAPAGVIRTAYQNKS